MRISIFNAHVHQDPGADGVHSTLCVAAALKMLKFPDGSTRVVAQGLRRARLTEVIATEPYLVGKIEPIDDEIQAGVELDALVLSIRRQSSSSN